MFLDLHTHNTAAKHPCLLNLDCHQNPLQRPYSVSLHPWFLDKDWEKQTLLLLNHLENPFCLAVGEIGLDRTSTTSLSRQVECFTHLVQHPKIQACPLIIHSVRTHAECLAVLKKNRFQKNILLHGFYGTPPVRNPKHHEHLYLGFGASLFSNSRKTIETLLSWPRERILLETDDQSRYDLVSIYQRAAELLQMPLVDLQKLLWSTLR